MKKTGAEGVTEKVIACIFFPYCSHGLRRSANKLLNIWCVQSMPAVMRCACTTTWIATQKIGALRRAKVPAADGFVALGNGRRLRLRHMAEAARRLAEYAI
jgi:hypothetical protein